MLTESSQRAISAYFRSCALAGQAVRGLQEVGFLESEVKFILKIDGRVQRQNASIEAAGKSHTIKDKVTRFLKAESVSDIYGKEAAGSDSSKVVGQPFH